MKLFVKMVALAMALMMLAGVSVACAQNNADNPADVTTTVAAVDTTAPAGADTSAPGDDTADTTAPSNVDSNGFLLDDLTSDLNFNNAEVYVLHWEAERDEFQSEGISGDNIMDNIYQMSVEAAETYGLGYDLVTGANIAAFQHVADAMMAQGIV